MSPQSQSLYQPARLSIDSEHDLENIEELPSDQEMGSLRGQVVEDDRHLPCTQLLSRDCYHYHHPWPSIHRYHNFAYKFIFGAPIFRFQIYY